MEADIAPFSRDNCSAVHLLGLHVNLGEVVYWGARSHVRKFGYLKVPKEQNYRTVFARWRRAGNRLRTLLSLLILQAKVLLYCENFSIASTVRLSQVGLGSFHLTLITVVLKLVFWQ